MATICMHPLRKLVVGFPFFWCPTAGSRLTFIAVINLCGLLQKILLLTPVTSILVFPAAHIARAPITELGSGCATQSECHNDGFSVKVLTAGICLCLMITLNGHCDRGKMLHEQSLESSKSKISDLPRPQ
uniref:Uncharacterized protein n=1 Tax=Oryza brachyantha TaxID=4533 RepID=J3L3S4_ORYBR